MALCLEKVGELRNAPLCIWWHVLRYKRGVIIRYQVIDHASGAFGFDEGEIAECIFKLGPHFTLSLLVRQFGELTEVESLAAVALDLVRPLSKVYRQGTVVLSCHLASEILLRHEISQLTVEKGQQRRAIGTALVQVGSRIIIQP